MNTHDTTKIKNFLINRVKDNIRAFCAYYRNKMKQDTGRDHDLTTRINFDTLENTALGLINEIERRGELPDLLYHLSKYWLEESKGSKEILFEYDFQKELFIAYEELINQESKPKRAKEIAHLLSSIDKNFAHLFKIIDTAKKGFFYNSSLPWDANNYPYTLFQQTDASITPASSTEEIQNKYQEIQNKFSKEEQSSMELLFKTEEDRMFVDVLHYPISLSEETVNSIKKDYISENNRIPSANDLAKQYPEEAPLLLYLMEQPDKAEEIWKELVKNQPTYGKITHCLALYYMEQLCKKTNIDTETMKKYCPLVISHWAVALADTTYWIQWGRERYKDYKKGFLFGTINNLKRRIKNHIEEFIKNISGNMNIKDDSEIVNIKNELYEEMAIEFEAVRLSQGLGGIVLHHHGKLAWFGPLWMKQYSLADNLARYIAKVIPDDIFPNQILEPLTPKEALQRLRWYFSDLNSAAILLNGPHAKPREALKKLEQLKSSAQGTAYKSVDNPEALLQQDTLALEAEAYIQLINNQTNDLEKLNLQQLEKDLKEIFKLADKLEQVKEKLYNLVLKTTLETTKVKSPDLKHFDIAILMLDIAKEKFTDRQKSVLKIRLVELLNQRAVFKVAQDDIIGAKEDLKSALNLAPHRDDIRSNLVSLLFNLASFVANLNPFESLEYLRQAEEIIKEGENNHPGYDWTQLKQWIEKSRNNLTGRNKKTSAKDTIQTETSSQSTQDTDQTQKTSQQDSQATEPVELYSQGIKELRRGHPESALELFDKALELKESDIDIQGKATEALMERAKQLIEKGDTDTAFALIEKWKTRLSTQSERVNKQSEFLKWWHLIYGHLKEDRELFNVFKLQDYKEVIIPFEAKNIFSVVVQIEINEDYFCFKAPLVNISTYNKSECSLALENLLIASKEIMLYKPVFIDNNIALSTTIHITYMNSLNWFLRLIYGLSEFADISRSQIMDREKLINYFREKRESEKQYYSFLKQDNQGSIIEALCNRRNYAYERLSSDEYKIPLSIGDTDIKALHDGTRISFDMHKSVSDSETLKRLTMQNTELNIGKLTLNENKSVFLSIELPYLNEQMGEKAFQFLEDNVDNIKNSIFA